MSDVSRRALLAAGAGGAGVLVLAGCSSSGSDGTKTPTGSASSADSSSSVPGGTAIATLADIDVGSAKSVKLADGSNGIVTRTGQNTAVAFSAKCTHQGCTVKPKGAELDCPCHGSTFDAKTGDVLGGPAPSALEKITVTVAGGKVLES